METKGRYKAIAVFAFVFALICLVAARNIYRSGSRNAVAKIRNPIQKEASGGTQLSLNGMNVRISYLYSYDIEALVVSTHDYDGWELGNRLSPRDFALAWGAVAENNSRMDFHWNQSGRWYSWKIDNNAELDKLGGTGRVISQSSNNHIIPADNEIRNKVMAVRRGDHIRLRGFLVNIDGRSTDGSSFNWHTSTTRYDQGDGACEVMYVTDIEWI